MPLLLAAACGSALLSTAFVGQKPIMILITHHDNDSTIVTETLILVLILGQKPAHRSSAVARQAGVYEVFVTASSVGMRTRMNVTPETTIDSIIEDSEGGMIRLETLIKLTFFNSSFFELEFINSSCSSYLSSCLNYTNSSLSSNSRQHHLSQQYPAPPS